MVCGSRAAILTHEPSSPGKVSHRRTAQPASRKASRTPVPTRARTNGALPSTASIPSERRPETRWAVHARPSVAVRSASARARGVAADLPDDVVWDEEFEGAARQIGADEHTDEIGHLMADDPDAAHRDAESAHREENDFSVSAGAEQLGVDPDGGTTGGGVTYTVEVDTADSSTVGELTGSAARVSSRPLGLTGAHAILAALDAYDPRKAYGTDGNDDLGDARRTELERALGVSSTRWSHAWTPTAAPCCPGSSATRRLPDRAPGASGRATR